MSETMLEEMRAKLEQKNAFDIFKKKKGEEEQIGEMDLRVAKLHKNMATRVKMKNEPVLDVEEVEVAITEQQAEELTAFFTKKEIDSIIADKYPIDTHQNMCVKLVQLSECGVVPKKPKRLISCVRCGFTKNVAPITKQEYWKLIDAKWYCDGCRKYIDELNAIGKQLPLGHRYNNNH